MKTHVIHCGYLKAMAGEMIRPWGTETELLNYKVDKDGYIMLSLNALLVIKGKQKVLIDPGCADFLPQRIMREYGLEIPVSMEEELLNAGLRIEDITDVIFTHLHFDHGSGAFKRVPGNILKRFPNARYHVLREHYEYALKPHPSEADSFFTGLLKYLDRIHWLEDWSLEWLEFEVFYGHTKGMVVPVFKSDGIRICVASDLVPMHPFLKPEIYSGYDLNPELAKKEKQEFLKKMEKECRILLFHDSLNDSVIYP